MQNIKKLYQMPIEHQSDLINDPNEITNIDLQLGWQNIYTTEFLS